MLQTGSRWQPWKSLLDCPGLYRDLNHLPKGFYERTGSHMSEWKSLDCAWTFFYPYCLSKRMKGRKIQDTWSDEGKKSSSVPALQIPYLTSLYSATDVPQILLPSQKSQGVSLLPQKLLPSAEAGSCTEGFYFQEISADTIVSQVAAGALPVPAQCVPSSLFHSLSRGALVFRSLCSHHLETTQMSCKS